MFKKIMSIHRFSTTVNDSSTLINSSINNQKVNLALKNFKPIPSVSIIRTVEQAKNVVAILKKLKDRFHAWDTETIGVDPKIQSPVSYGKILCMSCFVGPDVDFGNGPSIMY